MTAKPLTKAESEALMNLPIVPHPDGKPWDKCCGTNEKPSEKHIGCLCMMRRPANEPSRFTQILQRAENDSRYEKASCKALEHLIQENGRFMCFHRKTEDGFHRECAGWAAKFNHR